MVLFLSTLLSTYITREAGMVNWSSEQIAHQLEYALELMRCGRIQAAFESIERITKRVRQVPTAALNVSKRIYAAGK